MMKSPRRNRISFAPPHMSPKNGWNKPLGFIHKTKAALFGRLFA